MYTQGSMKHLVRKTVTIVFLLFICFAALLLCSFQLSVPFFGQYVQIAGITCGTLATCNANVTAGGSLDLN